MDEKLRKEDWMSGKRFYGVMSYGTGKRYLLECVELSMKFGGVS